MNDRPNKHPSTWPSLIGWSVFAGCGFAIGLMTLASMEPGPAIWLGLGMTTFHLVIGGLRIRRQRRKGRPYAAQQAR